MKKQPFRIRAIFSGGTFRPLDPVDLPESQAVELNVAPADWSERFDALLARLHQRTARFSEEEIDRDISAAFAEVRAERYRPR
jgi:predicted DNA-binding antitoxin AbrB/MazE fold protein